MEKKKNNIENPQNQDSVFEGRDHYFMDVDRMINEGLAGGTFSGLDEDNPQIEQARDLEKEEPPATH